MSIAQLKAFIHTLAASVQTSQNPDYTRSRLRFAEVEYHKKFSIPFACLAFGLMGVPLGLMVKQSGKMIGFGLGLAVILVYYLLLQIGQSAGLNGMVSPVLAMWLPNIAIGVFGVFLSIRMIGEGTLRTWRARDTLPFVVSRKVES